MGRMPLSSHRRLIPAVAVSLILLTYFLWFDSYTRSRVVLSVPENDNDTPRPRPPPRILLVSALFPLPHSKHSHEEYREWLAKFIGLIACDIYFYTTPDLAPVLETLHASSPAADTHTLTINTTFASSFDIPPLKPHREKYVQMHAWDRERERHNPELYAVWNAKPWFLEQALISLRQSKHQEYDYAFWNDAGSFRNTHAFRHWPDPGRVEQVWDEAYAIAREGERDGVRMVMGKEDLVFFPLYSMPGREQMGWRREMGPVDFDFSEGSFFGSSPRSISWYTKTFYDMHDHYISTPPLPLAPSPLPKHPHAPQNQNQNQNQNATTPPPFHFVGKDQTLINALIFRFPHRFFTVLAPPRAGFLPSSLSLSSPSPSSPSPHPAVDTLSYTLQRHLTRLRLTIVHLLNRSARMRATFGAAMNTCGDDWFYYQFWLAGKEERRGMVGVWEGMSFFGPWGRKGEEGYCVGSVVGVEGALRGLMGGRWVERVRAGGG